LSGQRILLIDDVMTTGASLNECARTLKLHGAAEVTALVVARAVPKP
jgi:predicted amidophosphoribosyltransferase